MYAFQGCGIMFSFSRFYLYFKLNCSAVHSRSSHQCNRITKSIMPLPSWSLCCLWHHRPQHLITPLVPWFNIHGSVLCWFKSYLSSRSYRTRCDNNLSSLHTSSCGVPQGSVLGPVLFVMYTTPLSTQYLDQHLYTILTQVFLTFKTLFNRSLPGWLLIFVHLCFKTEFMFIRLRNQLFKINPVSIRSKTLLLVLLLKL